MQAKFDKKCTCCEYFVSLDGCDLYMRDERDVSFVYGPSSGDYFVLDLSYVKRGDIGSATWLKPHEREWVMAARAVFVHEEAHQRMCS